jgi:hypothetical protein
VLMSTLPGESSKSNLSPVIGATTLVIITSVTRGRDFSHVRPFYEQAVSNLDRSMHKSLWVLDAHSSFIEGSHMTKNMASDCAKFCCLAIFYLNIFIHFHLNQRFQNIVYSTYFNIQKQLGVDVLDFKFDKL